MASEGGVVPAVSVIVPAYNAESTIVAALESVVAQTFDDWELIVCDDASTDDTRVVAESYLASRGVSRWRVLPLDHCGPSEARNRGLAAARGEWIAFLDDDDTWEPAKLARCVASLRGDSLDLVCHDEYWLDDTGGSRRRTYAALYDPDVPPLVSLMRNNPFSTSAVMVRRSRLQATGGFDASLPSAEDYDLWIRLVMIPDLRIGFIEEPLGTYRVRAGSESSAIERRLSALLMIGERYAAPLAAASRLGRLEVWIFRAKTYFTSGLRFVGQGQRGRGARLVALGLAMWPFRFDWVRFAVRQRLARSANG
jgi:glycosyltransferase involved in cell wall biosynthesis